MPLWNNNDNENSKPSWLTEEQKRQCFRTVRGWEIPLAGQGFTSSAENIFGATSVDDTPTAYLYRSANFVGMTELLVAMPIDATSNANYAGRYANEARGFTSAYGTTNASDLPNYTPYFTEPVASITGITGATLFATTGITSYIPVIAADANLTDLPRKFVFGLTTTSGQGLTGLSLVQGFTAGTFATLYNIIGATSGTLALTNGSGLTARQQLVFNQPTYVSGVTQAAAYWDPNTAASYVVNRYGGWGGITAGAAVLIVGANAATGNYALRLNVFDGHAITGATGTLTFTLTLTSGTSY